MAEIEELETDIINKLNIVKLDKEFQKSRSKETSAVSKLKKNSNIIH